MPISWSRAASNNTTRDTETGDPARLPAQVAGRWELIKWKNAQVRKIIFCTGLTSAAKAGKKSIVPARRVQRTSQERSPYQLSTLSPHSPQFQQSEGATPSLVSLNTTVNNGRDASICKDASSSRTPVTAGTPAATAGMPAQQGRQIQ